MPDHPIALELVGLLGHHISTSASLPDGQVESDPYEIEDRFKPHLALVIDAGVILPSPSSIISLIDDTPEVIREGKGPGASSLEKFKPRPGELFLILKSY